MILAAPEELHELPFSCHILEVSALLGAGLCRLSQWGSRTNAGMCTTNSSRKVEARDSDLLFISFYCLLLNLCPFMSYWCETYPGLLNFHIWFLAVSFSRFLFCDPVFSLGFLGNHFTWCFRVLQRSLSLVASWSSQKLDGFSSRYSPAQLLASLSLEVYSGHAF